MSNTIYNSTFFDAITNDSIRSAKRCVPDILNLVSSKSVVDVGCGRGAFLQAFEEFGITDFLGIDGHYVDRNQLLISPDRFTAADLQNLPNIDRDFDLAVCLEVAEHISEECSVSLVEFLSKLAPIVWFSAAFPGQGGTGHINEQWPDHWASRFRKLGLIACDCLRPLWLNDENVSWWYAQNSIIYIDPHRASTNSIERVFKSTAYIGSVPRIVHPKLHQARQMEFEARLISRR